MVECTKGGAPTEDKFNVNEHIAGVHIRFLPETAQEENLSSREFLKKCSFIDGKELAGIKDDEPEP
jgi:hypothetical protein